MKVKIENQGDADIRVITDRDAENDAVLDAGAAEVFESGDEGVIELREFDEGNEDGEEENGGVVEPENV
ncbi:hypothetical protein B0G84_3259 [Paraburkholderia sp. BL8N3]|nr:hypothetical protein [Paraburkholderia sp. BL8N3]TCK37959.1 hypothetical protein B0G84_3259 [Paraburkholderia sp. BL8N3]